MFQTAVLPYRHTHQLTAPHPAEKHLGSIMGGRNMVPKISAHRPALEP